MLQTLKKSDNMNTIKLNKNKTYEILYNCILIINSIENNSYIFINDYKINLLKCISDPNNYLLNLENDELKRECEKIIKTIIRM